MEDGGVTQLGYLLRKEPGICPQSSLEKEPRGASCSFERNAADAAASQTKTCLRSPRSFHAASDGQKEENKCKKKKKTTGDYTWVTAHGFKSKNLLLYTTFAIACLAERRPKLEKSLSLHGLL